MTKSPARPLKDRANCLQSAYFQGGPPSVKEDSSAERSRLSDSYNWRKKDNEIALLKHQIKNLREESLHFQRLVTQLEARLENPGPSVAEQCESFVQRAAELQGEIAGLKQAIPFYQEELKLARKDLESHRLESGSQLRQLENKCLMERAKAQLLEHELGQTRRRAEEQIAALKQALRLEQERPGWDKEGLRTPK